MDLYITALALPSTGSSSTLGPDEAAAPPPALLFFLVRRIFVMTNARMATLATAITPMIIAAKGVSVIPVEADLLSSVPVDGMTNEEAESTSPSLLDLLLFEDFDDFDDFADLLDFAFKLRSQRTALFFPCLSSPFFPPDFFLPLLLLCIDGRADVEGFMLTVGDVEGMTLGKSLGDIDGVIDGDIDGFPLGQVLGDNEGTPVGISDGAHDGIPEGCKDGAAEGMSEGINVGTSEGCIDGSAVGDSDGSGTSAREGILDGEPDGAGVS